MHLTNSTLFREYDPEIARWKSLDPKLKDFPSESPFSAMGNNPIMKIDVLGDMPGDRFSTPDLAAHDFGKNYNILSIEDKVEYSSKIKKEWNEADKEYKYYYDTPRSFTAEMSGFEEKTDKDVALLHTHGAVGSNKFSDKQKDTKGKVYGDKYVANECFHLPIYLAAPDGTLSVYNPQDKSTKLLDKDLPRNPNLPESKNNTTPPIKNNDTRTIDFKRGASNIVGESPSPASRNKIDETMKNQY